MTESHHTLVWVIDDDPDVGEHLRLRLGRAGTPARIRTLDDIGGARLALRGDELPQLVLLDHFLPDGDGVDFVDELRGALPDATVVITTAAPEEVPTVRGRTVDILAKPVDVGRIQRLLIAISSAGGGDVARP